VTDTAMTPKVQKRAAFRFNGFLKTLGPGLITGASDDDPSGIGTYSQAGAQLGFSISWTMLLTCPLMAAIQEISARIGRVTGHGIAGNVCRHLPAPLLWPLLATLFVANTVNIAADLGAMADALRMLIGGPRIVYVVMFGGVSVAAQIFLVRPPVGLLPRAVRHARTLQRGILRLPDRRGAGRRLFAYHRHCARRHHGRHELPSPAPSTKNRRWVEISDGLLS
jgi:hypothetical protein